MRKIFLSILFLFSLGVCAENLPNITAHSWLVADNEGRVIEGFNQDNIRSIASITKLITVMTVLDADQSLSEVINTKQFKYITRQMLIDLAIVKSDNKAATILCEQYPGGYAECIQAMNRKVQELGMVDTKLFDSTGLNYNNVSTANDLLKLVQAASKYEKIVEASGKSTVSVPVKNKSVNFHNTNSLVGHGYNFIVSKTGFITKSGGCIVMQLLTDNGLRTVILLGSKNTKTRIPEAAYISGRY